MIKVIIETTRCYEATLDMDKFIGRFSSEWADWMGSDIVHATEDDKADFVKETVHVMDVENFLLWVENLGGGTITHDDELDVSVRL